MAVIYGVAFIEGLFCSFGTWVPGRYIVVPWPLFRGVPLRGFHCKMTILSFFVGSFLALTNGAAGANGAIYKVPYPFDPRRLPIFRYDRSSNASLQSPSTSYDNGQTLQVTILDEQYTAILGFLSLHIFKNSSTDMKLLEYVDSWSYRDGFQPTKLVKSVTNPENFFVLSQEHVPIEFAIHNGELHSMRSSIEEDRETLSTVLPSADNDIYAIKASGNQVRLFSVLEQEYKRTVTLAPYCEQIKILYRLPAISQDRTVTFVVKCISNEGQVVQYHVVASYLTADAIVVTSIELGFPVGSSTYLAIRNESTVTVYNRQHLTRGVPQSRTFNQDIQKMVVFEEQSKTIFVVYRAGQNLTEVDAEDFFNLLPGAIKSIPGTLQDSSISPHMIVNDGLVVVAKNGQTFDMVALTLDSTSFTLMETARGVGTNQAPSFVTFVADPESPSIMTDEPTQPTTDEPAQPTTDEPTQSPLTDEPTQSPQSPLTDEPAQSPLTTNEVSTASTFVEVNLWIIAVVLFGLIVVVGILVAIIILLYCLWKKLRREDVTVPPLKETESVKPAPAPTHDLGYSKSIEESGNTGDSGNAVYLVRLMKSRLKLPLP